MSVRYVACPFPSPLSFSWLGCRVVLNPGFLHTAVSSPFPSASALEASRISATAGFWGSSAADTSCGCSTGCSRPGAEGEGSTRPCSFVPLQPGCPPVPQVGRGPRGPYGGWTEGHRRLTARGSRGGKDKLVGMSSGTLNFLKLKLPNSLSLSELSELSLAG